MDIRNGQHPGTTVPLQVDGVVDMGWLEKEQVDSLELADQRLPSQGTPKDCSDQAPPGARAKAKEGFALVPKTVYSRLRKSSPYIGFFHYAPSAGNRSRRTYFEKDIISTEVLRRQHEVRSNPMIGIFHYGQDLYGERFENFQRILAQLRAKDEERAWRKILNRQAWPLGGSPRKENAVAVAARRHRGRARSITDSEALKGSLMARSSSAGKSAILRAAALEAAAEEFPPISGVARATSASSALPKVSAAMSCDDTAVSNGETSEESRWLASSSASGEDDIDGSSRESEEPRKRGLSDTVREQVQRSFEGDRDDEGPKDVHAAECLEREERRRLRASAFAIVVYGSGDSLVKLVEKERRNGLSTKRFKYAGAIDTSKSYPKSGSLDDCALLRPIAAERSRLYNDLIAEVNGFRRHFFIRQKMGPKEAYRKARRRQEAEATRAARSQSDVDQYSDDSSSVGWTRQKADSFMSDQWLTGGSYSSMTADGSGGMSGAGHAGGVGMGDLGAGGPFMDGGWAGSRMTGGDDGAPPFHTLVGPGQFARLERAVDHDEPGNAWMPGTLSAHRTKESWRSKQEMRDFRKFKPFFVQAKTDFTATYRLLEDCLLGTGAYANVYLAEHLERGEEVAVKAVQKRLLFSDLEKKSVEREMDNQLRIVHRHVVRLYEVYETQDNVYMVLENCPCGDLEKMLYIRGRITEIEAKRVILQLLEALNYLHSKGIVHCDIKPQNLLFSPDPAGIDPLTDTSDDRAADDCGACDTPKGEKTRGKRQVTSPAGKLAKLCDFGISCKVPDVRFYKQTGDINKIPWSGMFGTGGYIAPEIMSQKPFGKSADLWSTGVMLYQMISGRLPFIPARACVSKDVSFPPAVWADVSDGVKDLICGLFRKDPSKRLTAAQALQHPWLQTIHHLRPSFPHFVPRQGSCHSRGASGSSSSNGESGVGGDGGGASRRSS